MMSQQLPWVCELLVGGRQRDWKKILHQLIQDSKESGGIQQMFRDVYGSKVGRISANNVQRGCSKANVS